MRKIKTSHLKHAGGILSLVFTAGAIIALSDDTALNWAVGILAVVFEIIYIVFFYMVVCKKFKEMRRDTVELLRVPGDDHLVCFYGTEQAFITFNWDAIVKRTNTEKNYILFSAVQHPNGKIFAIINPGRHEHCIRAMLSSELSDIPDDSTNWFDEKYQGFVTNEGKYVDRKEAFIIASNAGQLIGKTKSTSLYSKDVWELPDEFIYNSPAMRPKK